MRVFIDDGFTVEDTFPASAWIDSFKFTYRPAIPERFYEYQNTPKETGKSQFAANAKLILDHLISWDITDVRSGELIPIPKVQNDLKRLPVQAITFMVNAICGYGPNKSSDAVPNSN